MSSFDVDDESLRAFACTGGAMPSGSASQGLLEPLELFGSQSLLSHSFPTSAQPSPHPGGFSAPSPRAPPRPPASTSLADSLSQSRSPAPPLLHALVTASAPQHGSSAPSPHVRLGEVRNLLLGEVRTLLASLESGVQGAIRGLQDQLEISSRDSLEAARRIKDDQYALHRLVRRENQELLEQMREQGESATESQRAVSVAVARVQEIASSCEAHATSTAAKLQARLAAVESLFETRCTSLQSSQDALTEAVSRLESTTAAAHADAQRHYAASSETVSLESVPGLRGIAALLSALPAQLSTHIEQVKRAAEAGSVSTTSSHVAPSKTAEPEPAALDLTRGDDAHSDEPDISVTREPEPDTSVQPSAPAALSQRGQLGHGQRRPVRPSLSGVTAPGSQKKRRILLSDEDEPSGRSRASRRLL